MLSLFYFYIIILVSLHSFAQFNLICQQRKIILIFKTYLEAPNEARGGEKTSWQKIMKHQYNKISRILTF